MTLDTGDSAMRIRTAVLAFLIVAGAGCSSEERLYDVSGTVTFEGKPIPAGIVYFDPDPTQPGSGRQGVANIVDGKFTTADKGRGVAGGSYTLRVTGFDGKTANEAPLGRGLFPEYQVKKVIPAENTEMSIEVPRIR